MLITTKKLPMSVSKISESRKTVLQGLFYLFVGHIIVAGAVLGAGAINHAWLVYQGTWFLIYFNISVLWIAFMPQIIRYKNKLS